MSQTLILLFICLLFLPATLDAKIKREDNITAKRLADGYILSIDVKNFPLEKLLREVGNKCHIRIVARSGSINTQPISIRFRAIPLEKGIRRLLKKVNIKNYLIKYRNDGQGISSIAEVVIFSSGGKEQVNTLKDQPKGGKNNFSNLNIQVSPVDIFSEKVNSFKEHYKWKDEETKELAGYLLSIMPDSVKGPGINTLREELDRKIRSGENDTVDEEMFFQSIEQIVPSNVAPIMMKSIKNYSSRYKNGMDNTSFEPSPDTLYHDFMKKKRRQ